MNLLEIDFCDLDSLLFLRTEMVERNECKAWK